MRAQEGILCFMCNNPACPCRVIPHKGMPTGPWFCRVQGGFFFCPQHFALIRIFVVYRGTPPPFSTATHMMCQPGE